jgi:ligand-binding SRPBCC domain-containing protein
MRHIFEAEQWLPYPVEVVFAFFANPENLPRLMPAWQKARIEEACFAPPPPRPSAETPALRLRGLAAGQGTTMTLSFRPFPFSPFRVPWDAEIDQFVWNDHFCDTQRRGPFAFWHHCHYISAQTRDAVHGSLLRDHLDYELPLGAIGELAHRIAVRRQIRKIFEFRQKRTAELLPLMRPDPALLSSKAY